MFCYSLLGHVNCTQCTDVAYCYRCLCVCLYVGQSLLCKNGKLTKMPFKRLTHVSPRNHVLDWGPDHPPRKGAADRGEKRAVWPFAKLQWTHYTVSTKKKLVAQHGKSNLCVCMLWNVTAVDEQDLVSLSEPRQTQVSRCVWCNPWHYHRSGLVRAALHHHSHGSNSTNCNLWIFIKFTNQ